MSANQYSPEAVADALRPFYEWAERNRSAVASEPMDELIRLARIACDQYVKAQAANDSRPWDHIYIGKVKYVRADHGVAQQPAPSLRTALEDAAEWCAVERQKLGAVDGYDYRSGEEYGLRRAEIELDRRTKALAAPQRSPRLEREAVIEECAKKIEEVAGKGSVIAFHVRTLSQSPATDAAAPPTDPATAAPGQSLRVARDLARWIGYDWDGLKDYSIVDRGYPEWTTNSRMYQGGRPDLLRLADALLSPDTTVVSSTDPVAPTPAPKRWPAKGNTMIFLGKNGYPYQLDAALKIFAVGGEYAVHDCNISSFTHSIQFDGIEGWHNGVMFELCPVPSKLHSGEK